MKIIYVNCRLRNKYDSDLRCNEHYIAVVTVKPEKMKRTETRTEYDKLHKGMRKFLNIQMKTLDRWIGLKHHEFRVF